jgi:hypothetical protein
MTSAQLTPDNLADIRSGLDTQIKKSTAIAQLSWDGPAGRLSNLHSEIARLQALLDFLSVPNTTITVNQP